MKRKETTLMLLAAFLMAAGCSVNMLEQDKTDENLDHCIELTIGNIHPSLLTKANHSRGVDAYNENLIESVDCFFYPDGQTGSNAVFSALGRGAEPVAEGDSTVYKVKVFFTDADANRMFGNTVAGTCQVYVICNAPLSYGANTSVPALKELVVEHDFASQTIQESFVMPAEEPATVTLTTTNAGTDEAERTATGRLHVKRSAAKMQIFLNIPATFLDETDQIWEPVLDAGVQIMMANTVKRGKVDGAYTVQSSDYISTPYRMVTKLDDSELIDGYEDFTYTHVPFYSYPSTWTDLSDYAAQFVFRIPWKAQGADEYTYKVYQLSPNLAGLKFEANHFYRTFVTISSLGGADKDHTVVIGEGDYVIMDWMNESTSAGGQGIVPGELITYEYLVVDEPNTTLNNEETAHFTYVSSSPLRVGSSYSHITSVEYLYLDTSDNKVKTKTVNNPTAAQLSELHITVDWDSHPEYVTISHDLENVYVQWKISAILYNEDGNYENIFITQNPAIYLDTKDGDNAFVDGYFRHVQPAPFSNAYQFTSGWTGYYRSASYYRGYSYTTPVDGYGFIGTTTTTTTTAYNNGTCLYVVNTPYGNMFSTPTNANLTMDKLTAVHLSSFNSSNDSYTVDVVNGSTTTTTHPKYRIGDPRVPNDFTGTPKLVPYLSGMGGSYTTPYTNVRRYPITVTEWGEKADKVMIGITDHNENNIIAPYFFVNSAYASQIGSDGYGLSFEEAKKKCATYQEGGYPAGRWRLPTEAEIMYIVSRQMDQTIPVLFNASAGSCYWAASGLYYESGQLHVNTNNFSDGACRCVYDAWYWGDEPIANTHIYTPMP